MSDLLAAFSLSAEPLDPEALKRALLGSHAGALATFEGWVRDHNEGQPVERLEYSSYAALAEKEGARILREALARFAVDGALARHRVGLLEIGDVAVWVGVSSAHRAAAFDACRFIIEEIKGRVPIWKREHYSSGAAGWVNCHAVSKPGGLGDDVPE